MEMSELIKDEPKRVLVPGEERELLPANMYSLNREAYEKALKLFAGTVMWSIYDCFAEAIMLSKPDNEATDDEIYNNYIRTVCEHFEDGDCMMTFKVIRAAAGVFSPFLIKMIDGFVYNSMEAIRIFVDSYIMAYEMSWYCVELDCADCEGSENCHDYCRFKCNCDM